MGRNDPAGTFTFVDSSGATQTGFDPSFATQEGFGAPAAELPVPGGGHYTGAWTASCPLTGSHPCAGGYQVSGISGLNRDYSGLSNALLAEFDALRHADGSGPVIVGIAERYRDYLRSIVETQTGWRSSPIGLDCGAIRGEILSEGACVARLRERLIQLAPAAPEEPVPHVPFVPSLAAIVAGASSPSPLPVAPTTQPPLNILGGAVSVPAGFTGFESGGASLQPIDIDPRTGNPVIIRSTPIGFVTELPAPGTQPNLPLAPVSSPTGIPGNVALSAPPGLFLSFNEARTVLAALRGCSEMARQFGQQRAAARRR